MTHTILYDKLISAFIIRIFGNTTEQDVIDCFQAYYKAVQENFGNQNFNIIIHVDEEAHRSIAALRLIRKSLETQPHRAYIENVVAVNENPVTVAARNAIPSDPMLPFFINEEEAKSYLSKKIQEKGIDEGGSR